MSPGNEAEPADGRSVLQEIKRLGSTEMSHAGWLRFLHRDFLFLAVRSLTGFAQP